MSRFKLSLNELPLNVSSICIAVLLLMSLAVAARGQVPLQGSHARAVNDGVDIFSGKLEQIIQLTALQGRGENNEGLYLPLRNAEWMVVEQSSSINNDKKYTYYQAIQSTNPLLPRTGYSTPGQLKIETKYTNWFFFETPTMTEVTLTLNNGSITTFRDVLTNGQPFPARERGCILNGFQPPNPPAACSRGHVFRATDGSNAIYVADNEIFDMVFYDMFGNPTPFTSQGMTAGTVYLSDGSKIKIENNFNNISRITDRNGNYVSFEYVTELTAQYNFLKKITDSLNRQVTISYGDNTQPNYFDEIIYKSFGETERRVRINYTKVENVMVPGQSLGVPIFPGVHTRCYFLSSGAPCDPTPAGPSGGNVATSIMVPSSVVLPNGQQYQFLYNNYLELARIINPTGSYTDYVYGGMIGAGADGFTEPVFAGGGIIYRRVSAVKRFDAGGVLVNEKTFSNIPQFLPNNGGPLDNLTVDVKDPSGVVLTRSKHYFLNFQSFFTFYTFLPADYGREYKTEVLDPITQSVLRRTEITWQQREEFQWCGEPLGIYQCPLTPAGMSGPPVDPRITEVKTTLEDGQVAKQTFTYDQYNNVTDTYQYDFGAGQPGSLIRRVHTDFVVDPNYTNYANGYILRLPLNSWVSSDADGNNKLSFTTREYDNYTPTSPHAALVPRSNVSGFDTSYAGITRRGNLTAETSYTNAQNQTGPITSYLQYDVLGNSVKSIDAKGSITTISYNDRFGTPNGEARGNWDTVSAPAQLGGQNTFAFATSTTNHLGHTTYSQFDYSSGLLTDAEDENQVVNSYFYNDPLGRQTQIIKANNVPTLRTQVLTAFDDANRIITVTSDLLAFGDNLIKTETRYNTLNQVTETRDFEPVGYIAVRIEYDALGRKLRTSNPFRPLSPENPIWTTTAYDALNRVTSVTTPDNAAVGHAYSGNQVTITDQTGKQRRNVTDAVGRLTQVIEDPNNLNYLTSYTYNAKDDLVTITQGSQTRTQTYDSLSRLTSTVNPETGSVSYQYDANNNLIVKTNARGVSTHFSYDALDRVTRRWYNGSSDPNQTQNNSPALPSAVTATSEVLFFYDSQTLPGGAPTFTRGASIGRLVALTYGGGSAGDYLGYDSLGRRLVKIQQTGGINYQSSATYNRGGGLITKTYPSGRTVTNAIDTVGRTTSVSGGLGDGTQRTYASSISYSSLGGLSQEQLGTTTPIWNKRFYNSRGQLSEIREGLTPNDTTWQRGAIINHYSANCSGMCGGQNSTTSMTDNDGSMKRQEHWIPDANGNPAATLTQKYEYDTLNRLQRVFDGNPNSPTWQQRYLYDRFGNRTIDVNATVNAGVPTLNFGVNTTTNRLTAPAGFTMTYDNAGNLIFDNYTGQGTRDYDAENRMTAAAGSAAASYVYDGTGQRVRRNIGGAETWQVYGISSELVAEYGANGAATAPQKEYGYRNGQLLVMTSVSGGWGAAPTFTNDPLQAEATTVQAVHITELRTAINSVRARFNLAPYSWQYSATTNDYISANPIIEMRTALDQALGAGSYAAGLAQNQLVKAVHIQELRTRILNAWQSGSGSVDLRWLITDQLGSPRMIFDQSGSLANVSRHDYLPFGEELLSGVGGRTPALGYAANDGARQKFTGYERDAETGLDFAQARYYATAQGRFTSPDPLGGDVSKPQSLNHYTYGFNNPITFIDPQGLTGFEAGGLLSTIMEFYGDMVEFLPGFGTNWGSLTGLYESQWAQAVQITIEALQDRDEALQALADQDMKLFWQIVNGNPNLEAVDANGNVVTNRRRLVRADSTADQGPSAQDIAKWKEEIRKDIEFARLMRDAYRRHGPRARNVADLEARVEADVQRRCGCRIGTAGSTDSEGNVTVREDPNPWRMEATRRHEEVHRRNVLEGQRIYGTGERYLRWWRYPRNWAANEIKAYATEILYMQRVLREN